MTASEIKLKNFADEDIDEPAIDLPEDEDLDIGEEEDFDFEEEGDDYSSDDKEE
jgi:hypothetical protein